MSPKVRPIRDGVTFLQLVPSARLLLPLFGTRLQAGFPSPADDYLEGKIDLNKYLVEHSFWVTTPCRNGWRRRRTLRRSPTSADGFYEWEVVRPKDKQVNEQEGAARRRRLNAEARHIHGALVIRAFAHDGHALGRRDVIYSIDEAFCDLSGFMHRDLNQYAWEMKDTVKRWTGLPVGVGIGATKTLAKLANNAAKKADGVVVLDSQAITKAILAMTSVRDVWGIGRQHDKLLEAHGIRTAYEFANTRDSWIRKHLHVTGLRTAHELRGIPCIPVEEQPRPKKNIAMSRMFGHPVTELKDLEEAICSYATRAAEKLRGEGLHANTMLVFFYTSPFKEGFTGAGCAFTLPRATNYTPDLIRYATAAVRQEYRPRNAYIKAGLILGELTDPSFQQQTLFDPDCDEKKTAVMQALDTVNSRWGRNALFYAGSGIANHWRMRRERKSPSYTTRLEELLRVS